MSRSLRPLALALLAGLLAAASAVAQPGAWAPLDGPDAAGFQVAAVADDGTLFGATYTEVLRYDAEAATWEEVASAINGSIHDVAPVAGGRVWAGTSGALRSLDGGLTWDWFSIHHAPHSGTSPTVLHVAVGPDGTVYAGGYRSTNDGASWPLMSIYAQSTAFLGGTVYAGTFDGVERSTDSGATWTPSGLAGSGVTHLAVTGTRLVAATSGGIYVSEDGAFWMPTCTLPQVNGLAVAPDGGVWAAAPGGLYYSPDGLSWAFEPAAFAGQQVRDVAVSGPTMLAVVDGNPYRSTDGGTTWAAVEGGLGFPYATSAVASGGLLAVAASGAGPYASYDGGASWIAWASGLPFPAVQRMYADPSVGLVVALTGTDLYVSSFACTPWTPAAELPGGEIASAVAVDGVGGLYALTTTMAFSARVYRSADFGASWALVHEQPDEFGTGLAAASGVVAVVTGTWNGAERVLVSTDGGATWDDRAHPAPTTASAVARVFVDDAGRVYVGGDDFRLHRSADLGATWTTLGAFGPDDNPPSAVVADGSGAVCLGTRRGVYCSTDDGATFAPANAGLPSGPEGSAPVVSLVHDGTRYVALTEGDGVFVSDGFVAAPEGPGAPETVALDLAPNPVVGRAAVTLTLTHPEAVTVAVFDALGRRVAVLHEGSLASGVAHHFTFEADGLPSGVYLVRAVGESFAATRRALLLD
jgi:hypothetical protein